MRLQPDLWTVTRRLVVSVVAAFAVVATAAIATNAALADSSGGIGGGIPTDDGTATDDGSATDDGTATDDGSGDGVTATKYRRLWERVSRHDRRWAHRTSECESGGDPEAIGGGGLYRGAFQFMRSTWRNSPKSPGGDPIEYAYRTQAVVAVALMRRDGTGHWPNCG